MRRTGALGQQTGGVVVDHAPIVEDALDVDVVVAALVELGGRRRHHRRDSHDNADYRNHDGPALLSIQVELLERCTLLIPNRLLQETCTARGERVQRWKDRGLRLEDALRLHSGGRTGTPDWGRFSHLAVTVAE